MVDRIVAGLDKIPSLPTTGQLSPTNVDKLAHATMLRGRGSHGNECKAYIVCGKTSAESGK